MASKLYLTPDQVPAYLRGSYNGKKFAVEVTESVTFHAEDLQWHGGSKVSVEIISLENGMCFGTVGANFADTIIKTVPGLAIRKHTMFCGKDLGITLIVHPDNAASLALPPADELSREAKLTLKVIRAYKPAYRREYATHEGLTLVEYDAQIEALKASGHLAANGALTVKGKNAAQGL